MVPIHDVTELRDRWKQAAAPPYIHPHIDRERHPDSQASDNRFTTSCEDVPQHNQAVRH